MIKQYYISKKAIEKIENKREKSAMGKEMKNANTIRAESYVCEFFPEYPEEEAATF